MPLASRHEKDVNKGKNLWEPGVNVQDKIFFVYTGDPDIDGTG